MPKKIEAYHIASRILGIGWKTVQESHACIGEHREPQSGGRVKGKYYERDHDPYLVGKHRVVFVNTLQTHETIHLLYTFHACIPFMIKY